MVALLRSQFARLLGPERWRITADSEEWPMVPGRHGRIEWQDETQLAVFTDKPRMISRIQVLKGVHPHQVGDTEARFLFGPDTIRVVAALIQARTRRQKTGGRDFTPATRATSRLQDCI